MLISSQTFSCVRGNQTMGVKRALDIENIWDINPLTLLTAAAKQLCAGSVSTSFWCCGQTPAPLSCTAAAALQGHHWEPAAGGNLVHAPNSGQGLLNKMLETEFMWRMRGSVSYCYQTTFKEETYEQTHFIMNSRKRAHNTPPICEKQHDV